MADRGASPAPLFSEEEKALLRPAPLALTAFTFPACIVLLLLLLLLLLQGGLEIILRPHYTSPAR